MKIHSGQGWEFKPYDEGAKLADVLKRLKDQKMPPTAGNIAFLCVHTEESTPVLLFEATPDYQTFDPSKVPAHWMNEVPVTFTIRAWLADGSIVGVPADGILVREESDTNVEVYT